MQSSSNKEIVVALIGGLALIVSTLITGFFMTNPVQVTIQATQTAEARLTPLATANSIASSASPSQQPVSTPTTAPSITQTSTPTIPMAVTPASVTQAPAISRLAGLPFQPTRLFFVITGLAIVLLFTWLLFNANSEITDWARLLYSVGCASPFVLIWLRFFFNIPLDISTSNVLLITTSYISLILWFEKRMYAWVNPHSKKYNTRMFSSKNFSFFALMALFPIFIVSFGFTEWSGLQAFLIAIGLSIGVDFYLAITILQYRRNFQG